ncbi:MAG: hypothetical protein GKR89_07585 [Candidatus Latescibacteria bacterium]|nr:hypothetical protein [Candidatus Latescibacterota bacterium]
MARLQNVNTTDVRDAIEMGCRTMSSIFNADDNNIPFFGSTVRPQAELRFSAAHSEAHVPGRHLNALLNAEDAAGVKVDEGVIEKHAEAAFYSYSGPIAMPLNRAELGGPLVNFIPHNIREGFHALYPLVKYCQSDRARQLAQASLEDFGRYWDGEKGWDRPALEGLGLDAHQSLFITGEARTLGPLVKYYRATGYGPALELALELAEKITGEFFTAAGDHDRHLLGDHTHSVTCVMSSLAQLADLIGDAPLMLRVKAFYDNGLWAMRDQLGWVVESSDPEARPDRGEVNNSGDIVETALILGRWGWTEYYQDAERIVRGHMLPSQLRDVSFIEEPDNSEGADGRRDMAQRHQGAFGFPAPYGHEPVNAEGVHFNMDIVGGAVASLCEVYRDMVRSGPDGHRVNLLFDRDTEAVRVESPYTHDCLRVQVRQPGPLWVRLPAWVSPQQLVVRGAARPRLDNGFLFFAQPPLNTPIEIDFPLATEELVLRHRLRSIRARLRGDEVVAMDNFGADLTFFPPVE